MSGGQQQRVAAARALVSRPEVVFADEPAGNLDTHAGGELLELLGWMVHEASQTIVMVTHDPGAAGHTDRAVFLVDGRLVGDIDQADDRRGGRTGSRSWRPEGAGEGGTARRERTKAPPRTHGVGDRRGRGVPVGNPRPHRDGARRLCASRSERPRRGSMSRSPPWAGSRNRVSLTSALAGRIASVPGVAVTEGEVLGPDRSRRERATERRTRSGSR